jgi:hypothetical protein
MREFFSDREQGQSEPTEVEISERAWGGLWSAIQTRIADGSFGYRYPLACFDGNAVAGCDGEAFYGALYGQVPDLEIKRGQAPDTLPVLDALEFCHAAVAEPHHHGWHDYGKHWHLTFDEAPGQEAFRIEVNLVLRRNKLMYKLDEDGRAVRLAPEPLASALRDARFDTGDERLDNHLSSAVTKYLDPDPEVRTEALEELWDAWERLKTVEAPGKKPQSVTKLLDAAADGQPELRSLLETDAREITDIGNDFHIRHSEVGKAEVVRDEDLDYLFHRAFALVRLLLRATGRES